MRSFQIVQHFEVKTPLATVLLALMITAVPYLASAEDFIRTGSYTGDGSPSFTVTGIGFQPDVLIIKAGSNRFAVMKTKDMPAGKSKKISDNRALENDRIDTLDPDGFTVGTHDEVNQSGTEYYWVAMKAVDGLLDVGTYTGNGNYSNSISVANMQPDAGIVIPHESEFAVYRHTDMNLFQAYRFDGGGQVSSSISFFGNNFFVVGSHDSVNEDGEEYYYITWKSQADEIVHGFYDGNDNDGRDITGLSINPEYLLLFNDEYEYPVHRPQSLTGDATVTFENRAIQSNQIQAMFEGGFQVGDSWSTNAAGVKYFWLGFANSGEQADLELQISVDDATPDEDQAINLMVTLRNLGPGDATGVQVTDLLPVGLAYQSSSPDQGTYNDVTGVWDIGNVITGQTWNLSLQATVDSGTGGSTLVHSASITAADQNDPISANNSDSEDITVAAPAGADIQLSLVVDDATPFENGVVNYTLTARNNGPASATGIEITVDLNDFQTIDASAASQGSYNSGSELWTLGDLSLGQSETLQVQTTINSNTSGQTLFNQVWVLALDQTDPNLTNDTPSVDVVVHTIDLEVTKSVNNATPAEGTNVTYTLVAHNQGETDLTGIVITDLLPAGLVFQSSLPTQGTYNPGTGIWDIGNILAGETQLLNLVALTDTGTDGNTITNTATMTAVDQNDGTPANNTDSVDVLVGPANGVDLVVAKNLDNTEPRVGDIITFTVTVDNNGPGDATGIEVMDLLPSEVSFVTALANKGSYDEGSGIWDIGNLANGFQAGLTIQAEVLSSAIGSTIANTATVNALDQPDPDSSNDTDTVNFTVPTSDLQMAMTQDNATPIVGDTVNYTVTVFNDGPSLATGILIEDLLPADLTYVSDTVSQGSYDDLTGLWTVGSLNPALNATLTLETTVNATAAGNSVNNTARVAAADQADPIAGNNSFGTMITVSGADLNLTLAASPMVAHEGEEVQFTLIAGNNGPDHVTGLEVTHLVPGDLTFVSATPSQGTFNDGTGLWDIGNLNNGASVNLVITATVNAGTAGSVIGTSATVSASSLADPDVLNNTDTTSVTVPTDVGGDANLMWPLVGSPATTRPGHGTLQPVLTFALVNHGSVADTLHSLVVSNLTPGSGTPTEMDAEWQTLKARYELSGDSLGESQPTPLSLDFVNGRADIESLDWAIPPGDTITVTISGAPSLSARDAAQMRVGIDKASELVLDQPYTLVSSWPLVSGQVLNVDGFVAAQAAVIPRESGLLSIGSQRNLALTVDLPGNGFLDDTLYSLSLKNSGTARPDSEITAIELWANLGDLGFDPDEDINLGAATFSGDRWNLTGLSEPIPADGRRFFATVDIAESAKSTRDIRLGLPVGNGFAVEMFSGNDGPVDEALDNPNTLGISINDRIILNSEWFAAGVALPGVKDIPIFQFVLTNTYSEAQQLQSLTFTNTAIANGASTEEMDELCQQLYLRLDGNNNGEVDDFNTDPQLADGYFSEGRAIFQGLNLDLLADSNTRLFVTADLGLMTVADGNILTCEIQSIADIDIPSATIVSPWPLASANSWTVNGMIAQQIQTNDISVLTLGPGEGPVLALDLLVPANGYASDELTGIAFFNEGSATSTSIESAELWVDGGNGTFDHHVGDDESLGMLTLSGSTWSSTVLSQPIPTDGLRLFTCLTVADSPVDSVTVKLGIPLGGITVSSGNDGPINTAVQGSGTLVISTSPLRTSVDFLSGETNTGQSGAISMTVRNAGSETVTGIDPELLFVTGSDKMTLGTPSPETIASLDPAEVTEITWPFTSTLPGEVVLEGNVEGWINGDQIRRSIMTPTSSHRVYTPVPHLELYPTANLPFSITRGQKGLVPLTLTLVNPGGTDVANAQLSSVQLNFREGPDAPGIVPSELLDQIIVSEGTNIYLATSSLPTTGSTIDLVFSEPVMITGSEPVTLGLRLDLKLDSTVPSFMVSIEDASWMSGNDAINGADLDIIPGEGDFPISTGQANLVSAASGLSVAVASSDPHATVPGQADVMLMEINLSQASTGDNSSTIDVGRLAFQLHGEDNLPLDDPSLWVSQLSLRSSFQEHFAGPLVVESDSLIVLSLLSPVTITGDAVLPLRLFANMSSDSPLGQIVPRIGSVEMFDARDGNMNNPVPVTLITDPAGEPLSILGPASQLLAVGTGVLPVQVSRGTRDLVALDLDLINPGEPGTTSVLADSLSLQFLDAARQPLDVGPYLDRVQIMAAEQVLGLQIDPSGSSGIVPLSLSEFVLAPGDTAHFQVILDLKNNCPSGGIEVIIGNASLQALDSITGNPVDVWAGGNTDYPFSSGLGTIVAPADELTVSASSLMPPILAPQDSGYPVMNIQLTNPASAGSGGVQINGLRLVQETAKASNPALGEILATAYLKREDEILAQWTPNLPSATQMNLVPTDPVIIDAESTLNLSVELVLAAEAPSGQLQLSLLASGIDAGPPGGDGVPVQVLPLSGQTFPFVTETGNLGAASLTESFANFPNPFAAGRESTTLAFSLPRDARVNLRLLTPHGELVAIILQNESRPAGFYQNDLWSGLNGNGSAVHNGVYLAEIVAEFSDGTRERVLRKVAVVR